MRTLTLCQWTVRNWFANLVGGERYYSVCGALAFEMLYHDIDCDLSAMAKAIREIDAEFPWQDDVNPEFGEFKSIRYLSDGDVVVHNFSTPLKVVWFGLHPKWENVRKGQVYAYERYLAKLAEELAKRFVGAVTEVRSVIEVKAVTSFKA